MATVKYIDKAAVVAEIQRLKNNAEVYLKHHPNTDERQSYAFRQEQLVMTDILSFLDTLETIDK